MQKNAYADEDQEYSDKCANPSEVRSEVYDCYGNYCDTDLAKNCVSAVVCKAK